MFPQKIEQVAFRCLVPELAIARYKQIGCKDWVTDTVVAEGVLLGRPFTCTADLYFNYDLGYELEILKYHDFSESWHDYRTPLKNESDLVLSHMALHCVEKEVLAITLQMATIGCPIIQSVKTTSHTNSHIKDERRYRYVIFDSQHKLGFDLKLIQRLNMDYTPYIKPLG